MVYKYTQKKYKNYTYEKARPYEKHGWSTEGSVLTNTYEMQMEKNLKKEYRV